MKTANGPSMSLEFLIALIEWNFDRMSIFISPLSFMLRGLLCMLFCAHLLVLTHPHRKERLYGWRPSYKPNTIGTNGMFNWEGIPILWGSTCAENRIKGTRTTTSFVRLLDYNIIVLGILLFCGWLLLVCGWTLLYCRWLLLVWVDPSVLYCRWLLLVWVDPSVLYCGWLLLVCVDPSVLHYNWLLLVCMDLSFFSFHLVCTVGTVFIQHHCLRHSTDSGNH
jgi:hypothetical protein